MATNRTKKQPAPKTITTQETPTPTSFFKGKFWQNHWIPSLLLLLVATNLYYASTKFGYVLDDEMVIWKNVYVQDGTSGIGKIFGSDSFMGYFQKKESLYKLEGGRYRPLSLATFALEIDLFGKDKADIAPKTAEPGKKLETQGRGNPQISHWINIILYGLNGILLYAVLLGLFPMDNEKWWFKSVAFIAALIFIFHPIHSECVANIKGRDEILALMGSLGALYATMKYFDTNKSIWLVASAIIFLLGLFAKENTLTFLAVIPFTIWFFGKVSATRAITAALPLFGAALFFIAMRYNALGYMLSHGKESNDLMNDSFLGMNFGEKTATIFLTLGWYLKLLFYPSPLTHDYYPYHVPKVNWTDWRALGSFALYAGMTAWSLLNLRRRPVMAYSVLFFIITISIVSNLFVSVGSFMNERFAYMPSVAFCMALAWVLFDWLPRKLPVNSNVSSALGFAVVLPFLAFLGWKTLIRVPDWETMFSLNTSAVFSSPNSARAQSFYTTAIYQEKYALATSKEEKLMWVDTMEVHVKKALAIHPTYGSAWVMYCNIALARFDIDHQMDRLFHELTYCLEKSPYNNLMRDNIDAYMKYLATGGGNPNKICTFAYNIGYEEFYKKKKDIKSALQFLGYGDMANGHDPRVYDALVEVYTAAGQPQKAAEMKAKGDEARAY
jgi:hypothetical protein